MIHERCSRLAVVGLCAAFLIGAGRPVEAHAILVQSSPAVGATVAGPDVAIELRFNVRIDRDRSRLTLTLPDRAPRPLKILGADKPEILSAKATDLKPGEYHLHWQVLAEDGHITRGDVPFEVAAP